MHIISLMPLAALLLLSLGSPASAARKTCYCSLRKNESQSPGGGLFHDVPDITYTGFLYVRCSRVLRHCATDCLNKVKYFLDSSRTVEPLEPRAGTRACQELKRQRTPDYPYYLYAKHTPDSCAASGYNYLGALCCWEYTSEDGRKTYVHNNGCYETSKPSLEGML